MKRKPVLLALLFFIIPFSYAYSQTGYGYVVVSIVNSQPKITNMSLTNPAYADSDLSCNANVWDEYPEIVSLEYKWYKNGALINGKNSKYLGSKNFASADSITCEITPSDQAQKGEPKNESVEIQSRPFIRKLISLFGI